MIEIKKVTDPIVIAQIYETHQISKEEKDHVIATIENGEILHCAVFSYENETGKIKAISGFNEDLLLLAGLCRAILNILDINGVKEVYLPIRYEKLANFVGFKKTEEEYLLHLEGFFKCGCCNH